MQHKNETSPSSFDYHKHHRSQEKADYIKRYKRRARNLNSTGSPVIFSRILISSLGQEDDALGRNFSVERTERKYTRISFIESNHSEDTFSDKSGRLKNLRSNKTTFCDYSKIMKENVLVFHKLTF